MSTNQRSSAEQGDDAYRALFQHSSDAIWVHDAETGAVLDVNPAGCELYGYTLEEMMRVGPDALLHPGSPYTAERAREYMARAVAGETQRFEWMGRHRDGSEVWGEVTLRRVSVEGKACVLSIVRECRERKRAEEAERANRAKREFLSRMSHELRTPMNSILGFAQVLSGAGLPERDERCVQHVLRAGRHLLQLINEVLEISRIEAGGHTLTIEPVGVGEVLREAIGMARPLAAQSRIELEYAACAFEAEHVLVDRQRFAQVMLNLLSNAIKYNRPGGRVRISCQTAPAADGEPARLFLRVEDTGRGIRTDRLPELFVPFSRLGAETGEIEGTGLGLALSLRLMTAMGGGLALERTGGEGSVFRVEVQRVAAPQRASGDRAEATAVPGGTPEDGAVLLYIEDNLANLCLVETILQERPEWRTIAALQGGIGIELAREHRPDLILLDLHLPDIAGEEVLRRLRVDQRTARIPVVVISADATPATMQRLVRAGAAAFLPKPLDVTEFLASLERLMPAPGGAEMEPAAD